MNTSMEFKDGLSFVEVVFHRPRVYIANTRVSVFMLLNPSAATTCTYNLIHMQREYSLIDSKRFPAAKCAHGEPYYYQF